MIVASHQPDLFPYTGYFYKMIKADVFDLAIHDQFQLEGFQRRVRTRGMWTTLPLEKKQTYGPITDLALTSNAAEMLWNQIRGRYAGSKFWRERNEMVLEWIEDASMDRELWRFNLTLIHRVYSFLTGEPGAFKVALYMPQETKGAERVAERVHHYRSWMKEDDKELIYLSGTGAKAYMGDRLSLFAGYGIDVQWSKHEHSSPDSILTAIFDEENPIDVVLKERAA